MDRRELLKHSLLAVGAGFTGTGALAQLAPPNETEAARAARSMNLLEGQEGVGTDPRETHAYAMGLQAFEYGSPLIYFANIMWQWTVNPKSVHRPKYRPYRSSHYRTIVAPES